MLSRALAKIYLVYYEIPPKRPAGFRQCTGVEKNSMHRGSSVARIN